MLLYHSNDLEKLRLRVNKMGGYIFIYWRWICRKRQEGFGWWVEDKDERVIREA